MFAGCGAEREAGQAGSSTVESTTTGMLSCDELPPEADCPGPAPPRPVPMSPDGPVHAFKSEYWDTGSTDSENGVYEVAATAPGTFAETGLVHDTRPGHEVPVEGASVTYESVIGRGLPTPPGGAVRVTTETGYGGAFAFIDMPVARGGSCYRLVITAPGLGTYEAIDVIDAGVYDHSGLELDGRGHRESIPLEYPTVAKHAPPLYRACAAQGSR